MNCIIIINILINVINIYIWWILALKVTARILPRRGISFSDTAWWSQWPAPSPSPRRMYKLRGAQRVLLDVWSGTAGHVRHWRGEMTPRSALYHYPFGDERNPQSQPCLIRKTGSGWQFFGFNFQFTTLDAMKCNEWNHTESHGRTFVDICII